MASSLSSKLTRRSDRIKIDANLLLIVSISLVSVSGILSINPIMPNIAKSFNVPPEQIGLIMAAFLIPTTVGNADFWSISRPDGHEENPHSFSVSVWGWRNIMRNRQ